MTRNFTVSQVAARWDVSDRTKCVTFTRPHYADRTKQKLLAKAAIVRCDTHNTEIKQHGYQK
jgi:hypothetical protein